ncbi:MAG TPA: hypothetical protein PLZ36_12015, partial [Armatimonadota bacterium]|nr:hypothetical protein [Armatimonadota bacterium]
AFTERPARFANRPARNGQFVVVGVVAGNRGAEQFTLATGAAALQDGDTGARYTPTFIAWGTPDDFSRGRYAARYTVPPQGTAAGLLVFDVPTTLAHPRLLVRDLAGAKDFVGGIALERAAEGGGML